MGDKISKIISDGNITLLSDDQSPNYNIELSKIIYGKINEDSEKRHREVKRFLNSNDEIKE